MGRGLHRGFITYEELSKSLGKRNRTQENLEQALDDLKIVVDFVNKNDYQYTMFFSGKGFHMFVFGEETDDIRNIQEFHRQVKSLLPENSTLDDRVGQATRLRRVPNTVNLSSSDENGIPYYCIPIFENDLKSGLQKIKTFILSNWFIYSHLNIFSYFS